MSSWISGKFTDANPWLSPEAELMFLNHLVISIAFLGQSGLPAVGDGIVADQAEAPPKGHQFVVKYAKPLIDDRGQSVDDSRDYAVYEIAREEGDRLLLRWRNLQGWIASSEVLSVDKAIDFYDAEISQHPDKASAYRFRGWVETTKGDLNGGLADFNASIAVDPRVADAFRGRAEIHRRRKDNARALDSISKAIQLEPKAWRTRLFRGNLYTADHKYDKALINFDEAVRLKPGEPRTYDFRAIVWLQTSEYDRAISDSDKAISLWQGMPDRTDEGNSHLLRGLAWKMKGDYPRAIADLELSIQLKPNVAATYKSLGRLLATCPDPAIRDGARAVGLARKGYELSTKNDFTYTEALAVAYAEAGDFGRAVEWQELAIRQAPPDDAIQSMLKSQLSSYVEKTNN